MRRSLLRKMSNRCVRVCGEFVDLVTLKMVALCGRGGAGRDGDAVLTDGGWLGAEGLLIAALTDLGFKGEIIYEYLL